MQLIKIFFITIALLIINFVTTLGLPQNTSRTPISDDALEQALSNKKYLERQLKCAVGEVPCDAVGRKLKSLAPLVLRGACPQCTPSETRQIQKVLAYVQKNFPKEWNKILQQYSG
ncbi:ejaculatory bulb-specific protein 3-like [Onthophagus taurus]|uniref:ejaculatory bulb-specific protein 3-like n=1 Tax=Onthophagus taurus TaxID=166361 RepID=UPI000C20776D|nr:ejaculatory bulb-specific protein 3-like [Onthophagus taurus]